MARKEFYEIKGIVLERKAIGQTKVLAKNLIVIIGPPEGVIVTQPCVQAFIAPYVVVAKVQLIRTRNEQPRR